jgi:hypothetical protein
MYNLVDDIIENIKKLGDRYYEDDIEEEGLLPRKKRNDIPKVYPFSTTFRMAENMQKNRLASARIRARYLQEWIDECDECAGDFALLFADKAILELIYLFRNVKPPRVSQDAQINQEMIERAREYPITELIDFTKNKALCIWHTERNPSMNLRNNRVKCFVCGEGGNAIDVYMKLNGTDFITTVRRLQR